MSFVPLATVRQQADSLQSMFANAFGSITGVSVGKREGSPQASMAMSVFCKTVSAAFIRNAPGVNAPIKQSAGKAKTIRCCLLLDLGIFLGMTLARKVRDTRCLMDAVICRTPVYPGHFIVVAAFEPGAVSAGRFIVTSAVVLG